MIKKKFGTIIGYPMILLFAAFICSMFIAYQVKTDTVFSEMENKYLTARPDISFSALEDGSFMETFDSYTEEQLPMRDLFIKIKAVAETILLKSENNGIARGKDDFLFEKVIGEGNISKNLKAIENFVTSQEGNVYIAIAPTSDYVYEELVPYKMPRLDEDMAYEKLKGSLAELQNARIIGLNEAMKDAASADGYLYYKTDHHWTSSGAFEAYKEIAHTLGVSELDTASYEKKSADDFLGTYYAKYKGVFVEADTIEYYDIPIRQMTCDGETFDSLYDESKLNTYDKYGMFMHGNYGLIDILTGNENGKSLILFKDSYANSVIPFLTYDYEHIIVVDLRYFAGSVKELMRENVNADTLLLYNWSFVREDNHFYKLVE